MALTTVYLFAPDAGTTGPCGSASGLWEIDVNEPAPPGGVSVAVTSTVGGDTIASTPVVIPAGSTQGFFTLTPSTVGTRDISIVSTPTLTTSGSPITYTATAASCPDDTGGSSRSQAWSVTPTCSPLFSLAIQTTPSAAWATGLYCTTDTITITVTE